MKIAPITNLYSILHGQVLPLAGDLLDSQLANLIRVPATYLIYRETGCCYDYFCSDVTSSRHRIWQRKSKYTEWYTVMTRLRLLPLWYHESE